MNAAQSDNPLAGLTQLFVDLIDQGVKVGRDVIDALAKSGLREDASARIGELAGSMQRLATPPKHCSCDIPPPCWMPKALGDVTSHVCPGSSATVRLVVTNCSMTRRNVQVVATGAEAGKVTVTPPSAVIDPMDQVTFTASFPVPAEASECEKHHVLLWVRGCHQHFLRWTVEVRARGGCACHEVDVQDCPDLVHHWYDHFYCERPCPHGGHA